MAYRIRVERHAEKDLDDLSASVRRRVIQRIRGLATEPRPRGCVKLAGAEDLWRLRVGDYRLIYSVDDHESVVRVEYVRHRRDAYR